MSMRSQIYVRYENRKGEKKFIANYYRWSYGERMISRVRWGIDWIQSNNNGYLDYVWNTMPLILDVNFDMKDIVIHMDLIEEFKTYGKAGNFKNFIFTEMDNDDGKCLIDVNENGTIKYAFLDDCANSDRIMDGMAYMAWDYGIGWENQDFAESVDMEALKANIQGISESATLMTKDEVEDFINDNYEKILGIIKR